MPSILGIPKATHDKENFKQNLVTFFYIDHSGLWNPWCPKRALIHALHLLLVSFIHDPKHWCFLLETFSRVSFHYFLYDYHTYFRCNIHKGHFISFNALSFSNMAMVLGELPWICTIIPYSVSFSSPVLRQEVVGLSHHHHSSVLDSFFSFSCVDSVWNPDSASSADDTVVTEPIPSLDLSVGTAVTFWSRGGDLEVMWLRKEIIPRGREEFEVSFKRQMAFWLLKF